MFSNANTYVGGSALLKDENGERRRQRCSTEAGAGPEKVGEELEKMNKCHAELGQGVYTLHTD